MPACGDPASVVQHQLDAFNAIYEVQEGRISRAWSIAGEKTLD